MRIQPAQDPNIYGPVEIEGLSFVIFQEALYIKDESLAAKMGISIETFREALEKARDALVGRHHPFSSTWQGIRWGEWPLRRA